jgi:Putative Actinobacterial Holin-X, holin superfamily III
MSMATEERSISRLLGDSLAELAKLIQNEVDLARAEMRDKAALVAGAAKLIAIGSVLMIPALVLILFAAAAALIEFGVSPSLAYGCTGLSAAIIAAAMIWMGLSRFSAGALRPSAILDEMQKDKNLAKELIR